MLDTGRLDIKSCEFLDHTGEDISSPVFTDRHSKSQEFQNGFISWRHVFQECPPLHHSCLSMSTYRRCFFQGNIKEICFFKQLSKFSILKVLDSYFLFFFFSFGHQLTGSCIRRVILCVELTLGSALFFILIVSFPWLPCLLLF